MAMTRAQLRRAAIIAQREGHRLKWWGIFIDEVLSQVQHPEYLKEKHDNKI